MKQEIKEAILYRLAEQIGEIKVSYNWFIFDSDLDWLDELHAKLDRSLQYQLIQNCGDAGLRNFVIAELQRKLEAHVAFDGKIKSKIVREYEFFQNVFALTREIVDRLGSIGESYLLTFGLPEDFSKPLLPYLRDYKFSDGVSLRAASDVEGDLGLEAPNIPGGRTLFATGYAAVQAETTINHERLYFQVKTSGYMHGDGQGILFQTLEDDLRAFLGACRAVNLLNYNYVRGREEAPHIMLHESSNLRLLHYTKWPDDDLLSLESSMATNRWVDTLSPEISHAAISERLNVIRSIFATDRNGRRLHTACVWFFRSQNSPRPLDSLLECTIAIEVLVGDDKESEALGLTKLLRNRCAYMLGRSEAEREEILTLFGDLYKLRSAIVHAGRHRASGSDRTLINKARELCGRLIAHELHAMAG